MHEITSAEL